MISKILIAVLTELGSRFLAYVVAQRAKEQKAAAGDHEIAVKVTAVENALKQTLDGQHATSEQKASLNAAFRDLVRNSGSR